MSWWLWLLTGFIVWIGGAGFAAVIGTIMQNIIKEWFRGQAVVEELRRQADREGRKLL